jgi:hypothetical protein
MIKHNRIYFHKGEFDSKWIYIDLFGFRPLAVIKHAGWVYLNCSWISLQLQRIILKSNR